MQYNQQIRWFDQSDSECMTFLRRVDSNPCDLSDDVEALECFVGHFDTESNYSMLQLEENLMDGLNNLHFQQDINNNDNTVNERNNAEVFKFLKGVHDAGICFTLESNATMDDLIRLLKKWCLEGPYSINACVFMCYARTKEVSISNTIKDYDLRNWRKLSLLMKKCLKEGIVECGLKLIQMSPMVRYYGDLYPDNGRDGDVTGEFEYC